MFYSRPLPDPPIKKGDRVRWFEDDDDTAPLVVLEVDGEVAWVRDEGGHYETLLLSELRRLPDSEAQP